ncbi:MAG: head GIN domain-containing protein [Flavobacteriaceae bacterium]|nr:DUF2807 domain-containing protein [Flavobacteriaceae bacterium]
MKFYTLFFLFSCFLVGSQTPVSKSIGDFSELKVYDLINVELVESNENKIEITGEETSNVLIVQKNDVLKIKMVLNKPFNGKRTFVKLFYKKIDIIDVNEGAKVVSKSLFKQYELELKAQEGGEISVITDTKLLSIKTVTGGIINASGTTDSQNITIRTGGVYEGSSLQALNSEIKIKAGGVADVKSSELIEVRIVAGGDLIIHGKPKNIKQTKIVGGRIIYKD